MQVERTTMDGLAGLERAHTAINAAYNAIAVDRTPATLAHDVALARDYVNEARAAVTALEGHDARDDARAAARLVLPRLDHALALLATLGTAADPNHVTPLLDELGSAMDHVETVLAGAGWD